MFSSLGTGRKRVGKHWKAVERKTKTEETLGQKLTSVSNEVGSAEFLKDLRCMRIWLWYCGEDELEVFTCLIENKKTYEIVVCEIVAYKLRTNGVLSITWNFIRVLYDGCLMSV